MEAGMPYPIYRIVKPNILTGVENNFKNSTFINGMGNMQNMINQMNWDQDLMLYYPMINDYLMSINNSNMMGNDMINPKNKEDGCLIFIYALGYKITIPFSYNEKFSDVIKRYRQKSGDYSPTNKFIFSAKEIPNNLTVSELGLSNGSNILVMKAQNTIGANYSMMFTDLSKNKTSEIRCSKTAPSYRKIIKGINIFGICTFKKCKAYKKEVVSNVKKKKIDLIKERDELFCPECEAIIIPKTVGFYLCKFLIYGKIIENGKEKCFRNKEDEANKVDSMKYFDPGLNGNVMVTELVFEVLGYLWYCKTFL